MMQRILFEVPTNAGDTGTQGDTGPAIFGELAQIRWNPTTADTGADLALTVLPRAGDTGDGWDILSDNDCLGVNFTRVLRQDTHDPAGVSDTGSAPIVMAGDRLRVKIVPAGGSPAGRLYVYFKSDR